MRDVLPGFYTPSAKQIQRLWSDATFAVDANVLLGLYRYTPKTRDVLLQLLSGFESRLWLPHQVAVEYQRRRLKVIADQKRAYRDALSMVENVFNQVAKELKSYEQDRHPYIEPKAISDEFRKAADRAKASLVRLERKHPDYAKRDSIRSKLDTLFKGRVGPAIPRDVRASLFAEAELRITQRIPPGYRDADKRDNRYGDVLIWLQLLEHAKPTKKPVVFVTDDAKGDWWDLDSEPRQPRAELLQEMRYEARVAFWMYDSATFIQRAQESQRIRDRASTAAAVEEVRQVQESARFLGGTAMADYVTSLEARNQQFLDALGGTASMAQFYESLRPAHSALEALTSRALVDSELLKSLQGSYLSSLAGTSFLRQGFPGARGSKTVSTDDIAEGVEPETEGHSPPDEESETS